MYRDLAPRKTRVVIWKLGIAGMCILLLCSFLFSRTEPALHNGDIVFQSSEGSQSIAVKLATYSQYSHCGIVFSKGKEFYVYEAVGPVLYTPFKEWINHGTGGKYIVKRLKNAETVLTPDVISKMKKAGEKYKGAGYDLYFGWSDELIYCSELVWKIYKNGAGIEVGKLQTLKDLDLTSAPVKAKLNERYGSKIPYEEKMISPQSIADCELLETVANTY
ncbi:MAG: YiiX family permuted papain-like enzyme [Bacteroidia bacterium]